MSELDEKLAEAVKYLEDLGVSLDMPEDLTDQDKAETLEELQELTKTLMSAGLADLELSLEKDQLASLDVLKQLLDDVYPASLKEELDKRLPALEAAVAQDAEAFAAQGLYAAYEQFFAEDSLSLTVPENEEVENLVYLLNFALRSHGVEEIGAEQAQAIEVATQEAESPEDYADRLWPLIYQALAARQFDLIEMVPKDGLWSVKAFIVAPQSAAEKWDLHGIGDFALLRGSEV